MVHVHRFGMSGTYFEPCDRRSASSTCPHRQCARLPCWLNPTSSAFRGAHALTYSDSQLIAELIEAHIADEPLVTQSGRRCVVGTVRVEDN